MHGNTKIKICSLRPSLEDEVHVLRPQDIKSSSNILVHYHVDESPLPLVLIPRHMNPIKTIPSRFCNIHSKSILLSTIRSSQWYPSFRFYKRLRHI